MSFKSVSDILSALEVEAKLQQQPFQSLLKYWSEAVGAVVAAHTQPLSIQREVLWVATSSAAWAQNLTFERQRLLLKLNQKLSTPLVDIRFSTAGWKRPQPKAPKPQTLLSQEHPSYLGDRVEEGGDVTPVVRNVDTIFKHWAMTVQARSRGLPVCPQCQCPTPPGELERWGVCCLCAAKQFSDQAKINP